jgi:hypothetical protein
MRTLQELAETYERWADDAETLADQIMAGLNTQRKEIHVKLQQSAQTFLEEAERLRKEAARLRETWCLPMPEPPLREKMIFSVIPKPLHSSLENVSGDPLGL